MKILLIFGYILFFLNLYYKCKYIDNNNILAIYENQKILF